MRSKRAKKNPVEKDLLYQSLLVTRFINQVMQGGKKGVAERAVYGALEGLDGDRAKALGILERAVGNVLPREEVRSRRVGGATYQIPVPVRKDRATTLAVRWITQAARKRKGMPMLDRLTYEFRDAAQGEGAAVAKKEQIYRMAEGNRAFAHFRW